MAAVTVHFNTADTVAVFDRMGRRGLIALRRALKRTAVSVRTVMASEVAKDVGLRVGTVRDAVKLRTDNESLTATISISGKRIPLLEFNATGPFPSRGRGAVSVRTGRGGRKRIPGAFIAQMRSGHKGVFKRTSKVRLPIIELHGPSLPHVFAKYLPLGVERAEEQLGKNLEHELAFALSQE